MSGGVSGVGVRADQIVNQQEAQQHLAADGKAAPDGTTAVPVGSGNTISQIMHDHKLDWNNPQDRAQFLKDNPQFTDQHPLPNDLRSADLIYPGEQVYVRNAGSSKPGGADEGGKPDAKISQATDAAAKTAGETKTKPASNDTQATDHDNELAGDKTALEFAIRKEIAAGGDPAQIAARLKNDPSVKLEDGEIDQIVEAAKIPAGQGNPVGKAATDAAPLSSAKATNDAAAKVSPSPVSRTDDVKAADKAFVDAVKQELKEGATPEEIKARYGNDAWLNGFIDQAAKQ